MLATTKSRISRHAVSDNVWLRRADDNAKARLATLTAREIDYEVLDSEEAVDQEG
jgi:hypothetical protein